jgi:hypothetical protein
MLARLAEVWEQMEAIAGIAAAFFIGYLPPTVFIFLSLAALEKREWAWSLLAVLGLVVTLVLAVRVTRLVGAALYQRYPQFRPRPKEEADSQGAEPKDPSLGIGSGSELGDDGFSEPVTALESQVRSLGETLDEMLSPTRPMALLVADRLCDAPVALRLLLSLWWLAHFVAGAVCGFVASKVAFDFLNNPAPAIVIIFPLAFQIAFLFAVNLYLVMAVAVVCYHYRLHEVIWRWRFVIDLSLSLGMTLAM